MTQSDERRLHPRQPTQARGIVIAPGIEMTCLITDTSAGGLRIRTDRQIALPARVIVVDVAGGLALEVEVAWRKGMEAGLKRTAEASVRGLVPSRLLPAREAWLRSGGR
ncbi:MAG: PilZ domain-containing protein [Caulobacteraceae bacterium]|nr:PilZ domain-containing protein [Caulobacteraceae bacterium]